MIAHQITNNLTQAEVEVDRGASLHHQPHHQNHHHHYHHPHLLHPPEASASSTTLTLCTVNASGQYPGPGRYPEDISCPTTAAQHLSSHQRTEVSLELHIEGTADSSLISNAPIHHTPQLPRAYSSLLTSLLLASIPAKPQSLSLTSKSTLFPSNLLLIPHSASPPLICGSKVKKSRQSHQSPLLNAHILDCHAALEHLARATRAERGGYHLHQQATLLSLVSRQPTFP